MASDRRRTVQHLCGSLALTFVFSATAEALARDYSFQKIAIAGEVAPGTGGARHASGFFSVALNDLG
jgi:hypothetical protein